MYFLDETAHSRILSGSEITYLSVLGRCVLTQLSIQAHITRALKRHWLHLEEFRHTDESPFTFYSFSLSSGAVAII